MAAYDALSGLQDIVVCFAVDISVDGADGGAVELDAALAAGEVVHVVVVAVDHDTADADGVVAPDTFLQHAALPHAGYLGSSESAVLYAEGFAAERALHVVGVEVHAVQVVIVGCEIDGPLAGRAEIRLDFLFF